MIRRWRRLVVSRTKRNLHQLEAEVRRFIVVVKRPQLERRLRHDLHLSQRVGPFTSSDVIGDVDADATTRFDVCGVL